ncbi:MAG: DNA-binding protein WhiA [Armatimonadota bacterium]
MARKVSFTTEVKNEIVKNEPSKRCCRKALFVSCVFFNRFSGSDLIFSSGSASQVRLILKLAKEFSKQKGLWGFKEDTKRKKYRYVVFLPHNYVEKELKSLASDKDIQAGLNSMAKKRCCSKAILSGLFLMRGAVSFPENRYHMEFIIRKKSALKFILNLFKKEKLDSKYYKSGEFIRIYLKKADDIATFLNIVKAHPALLKFEEKRAIKETKNEVQRLVNCETANIDKTMESSFRQIRSIEIINEAVGLSAIPKDLQETAVLRLENPEYSLRELSRLTKPRITRLTVSRRLKRIEEIAEEIKTRK